jgi:signal recognition particle subunit SEC65
MKCECEPEINELRQALEKCGNLAAQIRADWTNPRLMVIKSEIQHEAEKAKKKAR